MPVLLLLLLGCEIQSEPLKPMQVYVRCRGVKCAEKEVVNYCKDYRVVTDAMDSDVRVVHFECKAE